VAKTTKESEENVSEEKGGGRTARGNIPKIRWEDSKMSNTYANVCNVSSTREEVTLLFGTNQTWHTGQKELVVELHNRVIVSPYAAKRLSLLLNNIIKEYESRFTKLDLDVPGGAKEGGYKV
jgi:hypothetical protein